MVKELNMKNLFILTLLLSACSTSQVASVNTGITQAEQAVAIGQLVCQVGPTFLAMVDPSGAAILAKGATSTFVTQACAAVNGVATALPVAASVVTTVITPPATTPLKS